MFVHSAVFGEVNGGHALRTASGDHEFARSISGRLDLPSNPPAGVVWSPTVSGFPFQDRYVLARTFLDPQASRGNMVFAHALFAPLEEIQHFGALSALLDRLAKLADDVAGLMAFTVESEATANSAPDLLEVTTLLVSRQKKPVVKVGSEGFERLISALWANLWPDMRREFAFRLSFGPDDLYETPAPALVWTPQPLAARWQGYSILGQPNAPQATVAANILAGIAGSAEMRDFADRIGLAERTLSALPQLAAASELTGATADVDQLAGGIRLIDRLSPSENDGVAAKMALAERLAASIPSATVTQIMGLRNFILPGFGALGVVWRAVRAWMEAQPITPPAKALELAEVLAASADVAGAVEPWRLAVVAGGRALASQSPTEFARAFWALLQASPTLAQALLSLVPRDPEGEASLIAAMPGRVNFDLASLRQELLKLGWLRFHGASLAASETPADALSEQLKVDTSQEFSGGLEAALGRAEPNEKVALALSTNDARLDTIAGGQIILDYRLLAELDLHRPEAQRLWLAALSLDSDAWRAPADPVAARNHVLSASLDGGEAYEPLVTMLGRSPLGDLSDFDRRAEVWERIDPEATFLRSTAEGWLKKAANGTAYDLDSQLAQAVLGSGMLDHWFGGRDIDAGMNLLVALPGLEESRIVAWLDALGSAMRSMTKPHAERLGHIILERRWSSLLNRVRDLAGDHRELRATLAVCASMLSVFDRWTMGISEPSTEEKWEGLRRIASDLYPHGPDERGLWERCGGQSADLPHYATGASSWQTALQLIRRGRGPQAKDLIAEMRRDFPANSDLRFVSTDRDLTSVVQSSSARPWWWFFD